MRAVLVRSVPLVLAILLTVGSAWAGQSWLTPVDAAASAGDVSDPLRLLAFASPSPSPSPAPLLPASPALSSPLPPNPVGALEGGAVVVAPPGAPPVGSGTIEVGGGVRVIDGETLEIRTNGRLVGVGLLGVDAPQGNTPCGKLATAALRQLVKNGLKLVEEPELSFDARERRMYNVQKPDGSSVADALTRAGVVRVGQHGRERGQLRTAAQQATSTGTGCVNGGRSSSLLPELSPDGAVADDSMADEMLAKVEPAAVSSTARTTLPTNFVQDTIATGLFDPTAVAFIPDGRILIAEKAGRVRLIKNGILQGTATLDISGKVNDYWDRGLLGIAVDPGFTNNGYLYLFYSYENDASQYNGTKTSRLARYTMTGDVISPTSELVLVGSQVGATCNSMPTGADCIPADSPSHIGGGLKFGVDGYLYLTLGDGAHFNRVNDDALRAQSLDSLSGKVLRVTPTGAGLPDNPFWSGSAGSNRSKIWAYGVRNPYRQNLRPNTNEVYLGDVGWDTWDELDVATRGANLGWPCYEGNVRQGGYEPRDVCQTLYAAGASAVKPPLLAMAIPGGSAVTGGFFFTGTNFPAEYQGAYFYGNYAQGYLRYLKPDANGALVANPFNLATGADGPVDVEQGPDGNLWYVSINTGQLRRVRFAGPPPPGGCPTGQYLGEYYNNRTLSGSPLFSRCDGSLDYAWGDAGPGNGLGVDDFSVRWTGRFAFLAGDYTFSAQTDDGMRIWIDGALVLDKWVDQNASYTVSRTLTQGEHEVKVEYFEQAVSATARVSWALNTPIPTCAAGEFLGEYYDNQDLTGSPTFYRCDADINFDWGGGGPRSGIEDDTFSVRWSRRETFQAGTYSFTVNADDGMRIFLDGTLILDRWNNTTPSTVLRTITAGDHDVKVEYLDIVGTATAIASWHLGPTNNPPAPTITSPTTALHPKVGDVVNFSGSGTDAEDGAIPPSGLSWRVILHHCPLGVCHTHVLTTAQGAQGNFTIPDHGDESYFELFLTATDSTTQTATTSVTIMPQAVRVIVNTAPAGLQITYDGETGTAPLIRNTIVGSSHTLTALPSQNGMPFVSWSDGGAQQHSIVMGASDTTFVATYNAQPDPGPCSTGQYLAEYFANKTLSGTAAVQRCEPFIAASWGNGAPVAGVPADNFSVRWTGRFGFVAGDHTFVARADDGVRAFVDGVSVIDGWKDQGPTTYTGVRTMTAGDHDIRVEYYEAGGGAEASFGWQSPNVAVGPIVCPDGQYLAEYYSGTSLSGAAAIRRCEMLASVDWGNGSPGAGLPADNFSVRWTGDFPFAAGQYTFAASADDGIRLFLDSTQVVDRWTNTTASTVNRAVAAGAHEVRVEYYEAFVSASARFRWDLTGP
jgi:glucose/arabinose dehydrogenase/endonuclease YncB( thermonuclease family)